MFAEDGAAAGHFSKSETAALIRALAKAADLSPEDYAPVPQPVTITISRQAAEDYSVGRQISGAYGEIRAAVNAALDEAA